VFKATGIENAQVANGRLVFSSATFAELQDRYLSMEQRKRLLHDVDALAYWVNIPAEIYQQRFSRDSADDQFIHAALTANAPWLVSGDQDLLVLADDLKALGVTILSPADAWTNSEFLGPSRP